MDHLTYFSGQNITKTERNGKSRGQKLTLAEPIDLKAAYVEPHLRFIFSYE